MFSMSRRSTMQSLLLTICVISITSANAARIMQVHLEDLEPVNTAPLPFPQSNQIDDERTHLRSASSLTQRRELSFWNSIMSKFLFHVIYSVPFMVTLFNSTCTFRLILSTLTLCPLSFHLQTLSTATMAAIMITAPAPAKMVSFTKY